MAELGLDLGLFISQVVNFGILVLLLSFVLYKPVLRKLRERAERIKRGVDEADRAKELLSEAEKRYEQELERARSEAREIIEQATRTGEQQRQEILAQARQDAHEIAVRAKQQVERQMREAQTAFRQSVIDVAIASASRLLMEKIDDDKHHAIIEEFLREAEQELVAPNHAEQGSSRAR